MTRRAGALVPASDIDPWIRASLLPDLGIVRAAEKRGRFRTEDAYAVTEGIEESVRERISVVEARSEELVEALYQ